MSEVSPLTQALFASLHEAPADPILGLNVACSQDKNPRRQNLGPGVYMDEQGRTIPLQAVLKAESKILGRPRTEGYLPIDGLAAYDKSIQELLFGSASTLLPRVATVQAPGGTGAVCLAAHLLKRLLPSTPTVAISDPTWPNHRGIFAELGFEVLEYPYYDNASRSIRFDEFLSFLSSLPQRTVVVLHGCCHNPTGKDFSDEQWRQLTAYFMRSSHIPLIDFAYQGFKRGLEEDAAPIRHFANQGIPCLIAISLSKSFSLYSQRVGGLHVVTASEIEKSRVLSQLKQIVRAIYSNPPAFGALLVSEVLNDPSLRELWISELTAMRERIASMRTAFAQEMNKRGHDFSHVCSQHGMFSYTGLTAAQVEELQRKYSIYLMRSGRVSIPALNPGNLTYICDAIAEVVKRVL